MAGSLEKKITLGFGVALFLLAVVAAVSIKGIRQLVGTSGWEDHTREVLVVIADISADLAGAETAGRGYAISGDEQYLAPALAATTDAQQKMRELRALTADNARQTERLDRLEPLARKRLALLRRTEDVRQAQGLAAAQQVVLGGEGKRLMDELAKGLGEMRDEEDRLLRDRSAAARSSAHNETIVIACGSVLAVLVVALAALVIRRDVTARRKAEEELSQFFTLSLEMLCIVGTDGYFKRVSPAWCTTLGYSEQELLAHPYLDLVHPDDRAATRSEAAELAGGASTINFENRYRCKDGSYRWLMWAVAPAPGGQTLYAAARDLTARRAVEEALGQAEERLRLMVDSVADYAIFMLDPEGRVATWNAGAQRIKGYTAEEIIGQHFSRFYPPQDIQQRKTEDELRIAAQTGRFEEEGWRVRKDGSRLWANVVISAVRDETGRLRGFSKVTRDVTERKRAEDDIRQLNETLQRHAAQLEATNKELEAFCYSVSHDLRAPLRSIDGFSLALVEDYADKLDAPARNYLQRIRAATQRMARLIDDLLNLSRVSRVELSRGPVDLSAMARAVVAELQRSQPGRSVEVAIADGLVAEADPRLLRVALDNLLGNAWKFTGNRADARIEFGACGHNGGSQFFVRDNGAGFDMAYAHKLFGAFQRLHAFEQFPGTGVGLATVQRIINRHGGRIVAEGEVDKGATFRFTL